VNLVLASSSEKDSIEPTSSRSSPSKSEDIYPSPSSLKVLEAASHLKKIAYLIISDDDGATNT